jgi:hypothetical protein
VEHTADDPGAAGLDSRARWEAATRCLFSLPLQFLEQRGQLEVELRPVLREPDFVQFDLERGLETVQTVARQLLREAS